MPPRKQVTVVAAKLKELNPEFNGVIRHPLITDPPSPFRMIGFSTDEVTDVSPVRALPGLIDLPAPAAPPGKGKLTDLVAAPRHKTGPRGRYKQPGA